MFSRLTFQFLTISFSLVSCDFSGEPTIEIIELVTKAGYPIERHEILTEDGYILDVFRLPPKCTNTRNCSESGKNEPVLIMHGLLATAEVFVMSGNNSLGFLLNDRGYDVWLGNSRGNWHSRKHKTLDPDTDKDFWKFTWHELGAYDLPAVINYILTETKRKRISFIGHSQGSTIFYVLCSERPEFNEKLNIHISLAPGTFLSNTKNQIFRLFRSFYNIVKVLPDQSSVYELQAIFRNSQLYMLAKTICTNDNMILLDICEYIMRVLMDTNGNNIDKNFLPQMIELLPGGCSAYQLIHYLQCIVQGNFKQYDWGTEINLKKYNSRYSRSYNISLITTPVALYYGPNDYIVVPEDIHILAPLIPNLVEFIEVPSKTWAHLDFLFGRDAVSLVYEQIVKTLAKYVRRTP